MRLHEAAPKLIIQERVGDKVKVSSYWPVPELTRAKLALGRLQYMFATCYGCEFLADCVYVHCGECGLIYLVAFTITPVYQGYAYRGPSPDSTDPCQCSTIGYSLLGACAACQGGESFECDHIISFLNSLELMDLSFP